MSYSTRNRKLGLGGMIERGDHRRTNSPRHSRRAVATHYPYKPMQFTTPNNDRTFEIPDDWWLFAEMDKFSPLKCGYYLYSSDRDNLVEVVPIVKIEPPSRKSGVPAFVKRELLPILFGFTNPDCTLPPVEVTELPQTGRYRFKVYNGFHRYYASVAVGYTYLPVILRT